MRLRFYIWVVLLVAPSGCGSETNCFDQRTCVDQDAAVDHVEASAEADVTAEEERGADRDGAVPNDSSDGGRCLPRVGTYLAEYSKVTMAGDCIGVAEPGTRYFDDTIDAGHPNCTLPYETRSADNCSVVVDSKCTSGAFTSTIKQTLLWAPDASSGTGHGTYLNQDADGGVVCTKTYDVTYTRVDSG